MINYALIDFHDSTAEVFFVHDEGEITAFGQLVQQLTYYTVAATLYYTHCFCKIAPLVPTLDTKGCLFVWELMVSTLTMGSLQKAMCEFAYILREITRQVCSETRV